MTSEETITKHSGGRPKKPVKRDIVKGVRFSLSTLIKIILICILLPTLSTIKAK